MIKCYYRKADNEKKIELQKRPIHKMGERIEPKDKDPEPIQWSLLFAQQMDCSVLFAEDMLIIQNFFAIVAGSHFTICCFFHCISFAPSYKLKSLKLKIECKKTEVEGNTQKLVDYFSKPITFQISESNLPEIFMCWKFRCTHWPTLTPFQDIVDIWATPLPVSKDAKFFPILNMSEIVWEAWLSYTTFGYLCRPLLWPESKKC